MHIRINSNELRELGVRGTPSIKKIGNGFIIRCPSKEDMHRESPEQAFDLFKARQKQFLTDQKKKTKEKISKLKDQIKEEERKLSKIDKVFKEAADQANEQFGQKFKSTDKKS